MKKLTVVLMVLALVISGAFAQGVKAVVLIQPVGYVLKAR